MADLVLTSGDDGKVILVDSRTEPFSVQLPAPSAAFKVTIKDIGGNASVNPITILRNGSELIDGQAFDVQITESGGAISLISDGTNWSRFDGFVRTQIQNSGIGLIAGGNDASALQSMEYVQLSTLGNALVFANLGGTRTSIGGCSSSTRGLFGGGSGPVNTIEYATFSSLVNASDFGDLTVARQHVASCSNSTLGVFAGGYTGSPSNVIDYVQMSAVSNASDFGDLTSARSRPAGLASTTRGIFGGGNTGAGDTNSVNTIDYIEFASKVNAAAFGALTGIRACAGSAANATRGIFAGGEVVQSTTVVTQIDYITNATLGNAVSFGNLTQAREACCGMASQSRAVFAGGVSYDGATRYNIIDFVTIATLSNAVNFGTLITQRGFAGGCSSSHGGLYV